MDQTWENGKKPSFGPNFGPFGPSSGPHAVRLTSSVQNELLQGEFSIILTPREEKIKYGIPYANASLRW